VFGVGAMVVGVVLMFWMRLVAPAFFRRKSEVFDPAGVTVLYRSVTVIVEESRVR
jgi:hypothetical protein